MTYYHPKREDAEAIAAAFRADPRVRLAAIQFEPGNGWVVVLAPALHDLSEFEDRAEIRDGKSRAPKPKNPAGPPLTRSDSARQGAGGGGTPREPGSAPVKGATAKVWEIADASVATLGKVDRAAIIAGCVGQGINPATAATQYSKWKRARGH